uniref:Uncharacterized protein n=1 Tax=Setaria italica TaxID=4555 RepID=K3Y0M1_SETIT
MLIALNLPRLRAVYCTATTYSHPLHHGKTCSQSQTNWFVFFFIFTKARLAWIHQLIQAYSKSWLLLLQPNP